MNSSKCVAAILLIELFFSSEPFTSCVPLIDVVQDTKLLLTHPGWKDIIDNVKTNNAEGALSDDDVSKLITQNEDITIDNVLAVNGHIFLMLNCRYASRLLFLSKIISDLAAECGYFGSSTEMPSFSNSPLKFCKEVLYSAFELISIVISYARSALKYFQKLFQKKKIASQGLHSTYKWFKWNYEKLLNERAESPNLIGSQLNATVRSLKTFKEKLNKYFSQKCHVEAGYPDLKTNYLSELNELKQQSNLGQLFDYLQTKIMEVSDGIIENNFMACGFLYNSETKTCTLKQPETSTS
ncbi:uncharacterized protein LOC126836368 [Adelges cooleyi]|uniref:uncharacterized protein LOC126836368 n=1 Tax=Adelges cooleyi TaxID=133065 RepID=UPI00217F2990|nr:uncharacterized protein LOC126836368 [Adelges cooleyi]XP_050425610.1 uncharacterized protein LOC126836368 [Adelges cooleyi]XP_050425611.1 uncharacterized protein LOC126836368 [Adelges cooleyi]XP_050425612.1 uncharacterized protein LOC126836368 [Adelges cooleyi]XP_050425613.1 uncharacterized protein LOC126836368 [Adelges cooleyi]